MKISVKLSLLFLSALFIASCQQKSKSFVQDDTYNTGKITIVADESFAPILDQEYYVFKALNKQAGLKILYKSENEAAKLFNADSVRVAILARNLQPDELSALQKKNLPPAINCFAIDAVTMIVNKASTDTLSSVAEVISILKGKSKTDKNIVFDNSNSSLLRYLKNLSGNQQFQQKNIYSLKTNVEVIKYVSDHPDAIGFISYSWLLDPDKYYAGLLDKIKIVGVKNQDNKDDPNTYYKPSQNTMAMRQYPLMRNLYIINATGKPGLGTGFASFLLSERGQRIVLRSGLLPDSIPTREIMFSK